MSADAPLPPIAIPRRLDRKMRLGPFPSARDAMKFAGYAAAGAIVVPVGGPLAWLPILGAGFVLATVRPDGKGLDERASDYVRYRWRRVHPSGRPSARAPGSDSGGLLRLPGPFAGAVLETDGVPIRFLPPADARGLFDQYRALVRTIEVGFVLRVGTRPATAQRFRLAAGPSVLPAEGSARSGYEELAGLLLRRRRVRRVWVLLFGPLGDPASLGALEDRVEAFAAGLAGMGVRSRRLRGESLRRAAESMGWTIAGSA